MSDDEKTYDIIRFRQHGRNTIVRLGLTLDEAKAHCSDPTSEGDGWFDGFSQAGNYANLRIEEDA